MTVVGQGQNDYKKEQLEEVGEFFNMVMAHCNDWECYIEGGFTLLFVYWHYYLMIKFLGLWAEGSPMMILFSILFTFMAMWNMAIVMDWPGFLQMRKWKRTVPFVFASVYDLYYACSVIAWFIMFYT